MPAHKCPVCNGRGFVAAGFYSRAYATPDTTRPASEDCRSCEGKGVVFEGSDVEVTSATMTTFAQQPNKVDVTINVADTADVERVQEIIREHFMRMPLTGPVS